MPPPDNAAAKQLLAALLDPANGLELGNEVAQEPRLLVLLYALRHAGFEVSGMDYKAYLHRVKGPASAHRAASGICALSFPGRGKLVSILPGVSLATQQGQWVATMLEKFPGFRVSASHWFSTWPHGQPLDELFQEIPPELAAQVDRAIAITQAWQMRRASSVPAAPRHRVRL